MGLDNIDVAYAKAKGIKVLNTPKASSISVAELTIAHLMSLGRFLPMSNITMRNKEWPKKEFSGGIEVTGKTLGIIGLGNIGKEVAQAGTRTDDERRRPRSIRHINRSQRQAGLAKTNCCAVSDYITLHVPYEKARGR